MKKPKLTPLQTIGFARLWIARIREWAANETADTFVENLMCQTAVERGFTALGEALKDLPQNLLDLEPAIPWEDITGFRNALAHDYCEGIEEYTVWITIQDDLPPLDAALGRLEKKLKSEET